MKVVLLPGLDGTGRLFAPLLRVPPPGLEPIVVSYPSREVLDVQGLLRVIDAALPAEPFVLVAESFSGPLAVRVAARRPLGLRGLVLVASFVRSPLGPVLSRLGRLASYALGLPLPRMALRWFLLGRDAPDDLVTEVSRAVRSVGVAALGSRLRLVLTCDVTAELARCEVPVLYLRSSQDRLVSARALEALRSAVRASLEVVVVDAPHLLLQRRPAEAAAALDAFARRLPASQERG